MIFGIGVDIVPINRIANLWKNHAARLRQTVFTASELTALASHRGAVRRYPRTLTHKQAQHLASRFAGKEATIKALRLGCGVIFDLKDIEVLGTDLLAIRLTGSLSVQLQQTGIQQLRGSCSCSNHEAIALVIGEMNDE